VERCLEPEEGGDEPEDQVAVTVRREPSREEPDHDQRRGERAPDCDAARDFALARSARDQPLDDREADQGGSEELCVEGRLRHRQAEEFEEGVPARGEQKDRERSVADRVETQDEPGRKPENHPQRL
jgi:hypothetical protein